MIIFKIVCTIVVLMALVVIVVEFLSIFSTTIDEWKDDNKWYNAISLILGIITIVGIACLGIGLVILSVWGIWI